MSDYQNEDPNVLAKRAERELNSYQAKTGEGVQQSDSTTDSGVNEHVESKFPGSTVQTGGQGASDERPIPQEEGGYTNPLTGHQTKAKDFQGPGGPEEKQELAETQRGGDQDV